MPASLLVQSIFGPRRNESPALKGRRDAKSSDKFILAPAGTLTTYMLNNFQVICAEGPHMPFKALFIGINKHQDAGILELTGAVRDAQALHALFQDTFSDIDGRLLTDSDATLEAIRANLDRTLTTSTPGPHNRESHSELCTIETQQEKT